MLKHAIQNTMHSMQFYGKYAKTCSSPMNIFPLHMDGIIVCKIYKNEHKYAKYARVKYI